MATTAAAAGAPATRLAPGRSAVPRVLPQRCLRRSRLALARFPRSFLLDPMPSGPRQVPVFAASTTVRSPSSSSLLSRASHRGRPCSRRRLHNARACRTAGSFCYCRLRRRSERRPTERQSEGRTEARHGARRCGAAKHGPRAWPAARIRGTSDRQRRRRPAKETYKSCIRSIYQRQNSLKMGTQFHLSGRCILFPQIDS